MTARQKEAEINEKPPLCTISGFEHKPAQATTSEGPVVISWSSKCNHLVLFTCGCQRGGRERRKRQGKERNEEETNGRLYIQE